MLDWVEDRTKERHPFCPSVLSRYPFYPALFLFFSFFSVFLPLSRVHFFRFLDLLLLLPLLPLPSLLLLLYLNHTSSHHQHCCITSSSIKSKRRGCTSKRIPVQSRPPHQTPQPPGPSLSPLHSIFLPVQVQKHSPITKSSPIRSSRSINQSHHITLRRALAPSRPTHLVKSQFRIPSEPTDLEPLLLVGRIQPASNPSPGLFYSSRPPTEDHPWTSNCEPNRISMLLSQ
ncbi:hypothetical protein BKA65DRAFT_10686 [Rhexocercosporidium sp. MPI-PUGE-AT-0058]|nr:hypothetical protein BKA65DRAFT_10686 [Rhexocercosporidium sp. MPI-PUGE-AT-0058]